MTLGALFWSGVGTTAAGLAGLIAAEWSGSKTLAAITKPLASTGFLIAAVGAGARETRYGRWLLGGLALGWVGDVALLSRSQAGFLTGLGSFLAGHVAYAGAFVVRGFSLAGTVKAAAVLTPPALLVWKWLEPHVAPDMRAPVIAYITVITSMVALAWGTHMVLPSLVLLTGAAAFYLSDLSVARDRFMNAGFENKLWGLPLYYGAQILLASTARRAR